MSYIELHSDGPGVSGYRRVDTVWRATRRRKWWELWRPKWIELPQGTAWRKGDIIQMDPVIVQVNPGTYTAFGILDKEREVNGD